MVKKLLKHEYLAWLRILPLVYGITLAIAVLLRMVVAFESQSVYYDIVLVSGIFMCVVALIATAVTPTIFGIVRFHRNMFTGEGYLTNTLPVTAANHLWVKVLTAVSFDILSLLVCVLAIMIATAGDVLTEIWKAGIYLLQQIPEKYLGHFSGWVAEYGLLLLVSMFCSHFVFYFCICVGQLSKKNRKLTAVGVYFGMYALTQILSTVVTVQIAALSDAGKLDPILFWIEKNIEPSIHIGLLVAVLATALITLVYYWICHHIIRKKLNLE